MARKIVFIIFMAGLHAAHSAPSALETMPPTMAPRTFFENIERREVLIGKFAVFLCFMGGLLFISTWIMNWRRQNPAGSKNGMGINAGVCAFEPDGGISRVARVLNGHDIDMADHIRFMEAVTPLLGLGPAPLERGSGKDSTLNPFHDPESGEHKAREAAKDKERLAAVLSLFGIPKSSHKAMVRELIDALEATRASAYAAGEGSQRLNRNNQEDPPQQPWTEVLLVTIVASGVVVTAAAVVILF